MAIWQVYVELIKVDTSIFRFDSLIMIDKLMSILPEQKSWCSTIKQFGKLDSTCIELSLSDLDFIETVSLRIDIRNITKQQLATISEFLISNKFLIKYDNLFFEPTIENFLKILNNSQANCFIKNPKKFLFELQKHRLHDQNEPKTEKTGNLSEDDSKL